jgi:hypothetical protein
VGQAAFLEFNGVNIGGAFPEDAVLVNFLDELLLHLEDAGHQFRTIVRSLTSEKSACDLCPLWICGDGNEKIDLHAN